MLTVTLRPLFHRGKENIALDAPNQREMNQAICKLPGVRWSQTHKVWYLPWGKASCEAIVAAIKPLAQLDTRVLKAYLEKRDAVKQTLVPGAAAVQSAPSAPQQPFVRKLPVQTPAWKLSPENVQALQRFVEQLKLKAYSQSTLRTYRGEFLQLLQLLKQTPVDTLTPEDLRRYFVYCFDKLGLKENTLHSRINAIKFYFEQVLGRERFFGKYPGPKSPCNYRSC